MHLEEYVWFQHRRGLSLGALRLAFAAFVVLLAQTAALTQRTDCNSGSAPMAEVQVSVHDAISSMSQSGDRDGLVNLACNIRLTVQDVDGHGVNDGVGQATVVTISSNAPLSWEQHSTNQMVRVFALALTPPLHEVSTVSVENICSAQPASAMVDITSAPEGEFQEFTAGSRGSSTIGGGSMDGRWSWRATLRRGEDCLGSSLVHGHMGEETEARYFRSNLLPGRRYLCVAAAVYQSVVADEGRQEEILRTVQAVAFADFLGVTFRPSLEDPHGETVCATVDPATRPASRTSSEQVLPQWVRCTIELAGWFPVVGTGELRLTHAQGRRTEKRLLRGSAYLADLVLVVDVAVAQPHARHRHRLPITVVTYHVIDMSSTEVTTFLVNAAETSSFERQVAAGLVDCNRVSALNVELLAPHHGSLWIDDALLPMDDSSDEPIGAQVKEVEPTNLTITKVTVHISEQRSLSVAHSAAELHQAQPVQGVLLEVDLAFPRSSSSDAAGTLFSGSTAFPCRRSRVVSTLSESTFVQTWTCPVTSHEALHRLLSPRTLAASSALLFEWHSGPHRDSPSFGSAPASIAVPSTVTSLSTRDWGIAREGPVFSSGTGEKNTAPVSLATVSSHYIHLWCLKEGHHTLDVYVRDGSGGDGLLTWASCDDSFTQSVASEPSNTGAVADATGNIFLSLRRCQVPRWSILAGTTMNVSCGSKGAPAPPLSSPETTLLQVSVPFGLRLLHREQPAFVVLASIFHEGSRRADLVSDVHVERLHNGSSPTEACASIRAAAYLPSQKRNSKKLFDVESWQQHLTSSGGRTLDEKPRDISPDEWTEMVVAGDKREQGAFSRRPLMITSVPGSLPLRSGWLVTWVCSSSSRDSCDIHVLPLLLIPHAVPSPLTASFRLRCGPPSDFPCNAYTQVQSRVVLLPQAAASRTTWSPAVVAPSWCKSPGSAAIQIARVTFDTETFLTQATGDGGGGVGAVDAASQRNGTSGTVVFRVNRPTVEEFGRTNITGVFGPFAVCSDVFTEVMTPVIEEHFAQNGLSRMPQRGPLKGTTSEDARGHGNNAAPATAAPTTALIGSGSFTSSPLVQAVAFPSLSRTVRTLGDSWWGLFVTNLRQLSHALGVAKTHHRRASPLAKILSRHTLRIVPLPETHGARDYMSRRKTFRLCSAQAIASNETLRAYSLVAADAQAVAEAAATVFPTAQLSGPPAWVVRTPGSLYGERAICAEVDGVHEFVGVLSIPGPAFASSAFDAIGGTSENRRVQRTPVALGQPVELGFSIVVSSAAEFLRSSFQLLRYEDGGWNAVVGIDKPSIEDRSSSPHHNNGGSPSRGTTQPAESVTALEMDSPVRYEEVVRPSLPSLVERVIFPILRIHVPGHYLVGFAKGLAWDGATRRGTAARSREQQHLLQTLKDAVRNAPLSSGDASSVNCDEGSQQESTESPSTSTSSSSPQVSSWWEYVGVAAILGVNRTTTPALPTLTDVRTATVLIVDPVSLDHRHITVTSLPPGVVQLRIAAGGHRIQLRNVAVWATVCSSSSGGSHSKREKTSLVGGGDESLTGFSGTLRAKTVLHNSDGSLELRFLLKTENLCEKSRLSLVAGWRRVQQSVVSRARLASNATQVETTRIVWRILCRDIVIPRSVLDDVVLSTASLRGDSLHRDVPTLSGRPPLGRQALSSDDDEEHRGNRGCSTADGGGTEALDAMDLDGIDEI